MTSFIIRDHGQIVATFTSVDMLCRFVQSSPDIFDSRGDMLVTCNKVAILNCREEHTNAYALVTLADKILFEYYRVIQHDCWLYAEWRIDQMSAILLQRAGLHNDASILRESIGQSITEWKKGR